MAAKATVFPLSTAKAAQEDAKTRTTADAQGDRVVSRDPLYHTDRYRLVVPLAGRLRTIVDAIRPKADPGA